MSLAEYNEEETPKTPLICDSSSKETSTLMILSNDTGTGRQNECSAMSDNDLRIVSLNSCLSNSWVQLGESSHMEMEMCNETDEFLKVRRNSYCSRVDENEVDEHIRGDSACDQAIICKTDDVLDLESKTLDERTLRNVDSEKDNIEKQCSSSADFECQNEADLTLDLTLNIGEKLIDNNDVEVEKKITEAKTCKASSDENSKRFSSTSNVSLDICCRICHCGDEDEKLISPCACAGSLQFVHESCLIQWMRGKMTYNCELCQGKIEIARRLKPLWQWQRPEQRPFALIWVFTFIVAMILNIASVVKDASENCTSTPCIVFYSIGCFGAIVAAIFIVYFGKRAREIIRQWIKINEVWIILEKQSTMQSKKIRHGGPKTQRVLFTTSGLKTMV